MKRSQRVASACRVNAAFEMTNGVFDQSTSGGHVCQLQSGWQALDSQSGMASLTSEAQAETQWASYICTRWRRPSRVCKRKKHTGLSMENKYQGLDQHDTDVTDSPHKDNPFNKKLLDYFRALAASNVDTDEVDLQFVNDVIVRGADVNITDRHGQTCLHEISRSWNVDVMRFFLERGGDIQRADNYGVTPLHVAAALDYEEMIHFLLERKADAGARTHIVQQTPLHFAAKNDAAGAVRILLQSGADVSARDYKQRTPLQLAANLDCSEAARTLMELGADAGVQDSDGQLCISAMIDRMTPVAHLALNQFHVKDRMTRQQFYYLHLLEPEPPSNQSSQCLGSNEKTRSEPMSPLEFIVQREKLDLIMHPVVLKLITVKWNLYGRTGAWILLLLNFFFIISWTTVAVSVSVVRDEDRRYVFPDDWWRVLVVLLALVLTMKEVYREVAELLLSYRKLRQWQRWFECRIHEDLHCTHPMWPEERHFFEKQIKFVRKMKPSYFKDLWNVFDWLVYVLLMVVLGIHIADIFLVEKTLREYSLRLFAVTIIFLWLRLMKHVRAFRMMGPFIVMLGKIVGDVLRFMFLYIEIFIPYAFAFWIIFGGMVAVPSMQTIPQLLYSLYRITLVDEYEFDAMLRVDPVMAYLLCGTFLGLSAILCVNLLIALLSDTFQRIYENALANAVMQQASIILQVEESMPWLRRLCDNQYLHNHCAPLGEFYDEDFVTNPQQHATMKEITMQIKETLDKFLEINKGVYPPDAGNLNDGTRDEGLQRTLTQEKEGLLRVLQNLQREQNLQNQDLSILKKDMKELRILLEHLILSKPILCEESKSPYLENTDKGRPTN